MKLTPEKIEQCAQWVRENGLIDNGGATITDFCKALEIDRKTYYNWLSDSTFSTSIKEAKKMFADTLERDIVVSLAKSAKGYKYVKRKTEYKNGKDGKPIIAKQTTEDVEVQPNVGAAVFLLTNIAPERWKNKMTNDITADVKATAEVESKFDANDIGDDLLFAIADKLQDGQHERVMKEKNG